MREIWQQRRRSWSLGAACSMAVVAAIAGCKQPDNGVAGGSGGNAATPGSTTGGEKARPYTGSDILLGEYGSLSGTTATYGKSTHEGVTLAVEEINKAGGVLNKNIRVKVEDDGSKPEQAATVVTKLINSDNVLTVIGEVASSRSLAAAPICQGAGVPMVSPSSTNPKVTQVGDYIFRTCFIDPFQGPMIVRFARDHLKAKTAAILQDIKNAYSVGLTEVITEAFTKGGGKIVATESFSEGDKDFRAQLTGIKRAKPDVIFIPAYYTEVGLIARQARSSGINQPLLGGDGWDSPKLVEIGKDAVQGCYFSTHYSPQSKDPRVVKFVADYKARFHKIPDALAAVGYDAARVTIDAIKRAGGTDRAKIRDALAATTDFPGVTGNITIDKDRNAVKPLVILQVKGKEYAYVTTMKPE
jgi:branched-chain amino acid transport system substrate-binding protein